MSWYPVIAVYVALGVYTVYAFTTSFGRKGREMSWPEKQAQAYRVAAWGLITISFDFLAIGLLVTSVWTWVSYAVAGVLAALAHPAFKMAQPQRWRERQQ